MDFPFRSTMIASDHDPGPESAIIRAGVWNFTRLRNPYRPCENSRDLRSEAVRRGRERKGAAHQAPQIMRLRRSPDV